MLGFKLKSNFKQQIDKSTEKQRTNKQ